MTEVLYRFVVDIVADTDEPEATGFSILEQLDGELDNLGDMLVGDADYIRVESRDLGMKRLEASDVS